MKRFAYFAKDKDGAVGQLFLIFADKRPSASVVENLRQQLMAARRVILPTPEYYTVQELHVIPESERETAQPIARPIELYVPGRNGGAA